MIEIVEISQKLYTDVLGVQDSELAARQVRILLKGSDCWLVTVWPQSHHKLPGSCRLQSSSWLQLQYFTVSIYTVNVGGWGCGILISPDYQRRKLVSSEMESYLGIKQLMVIKISDIRHGEITNILPYNITLQEMRHLEHLLFFFTIQWSFLVPLTGGR